MIFRMMILFRVNISETLLASIIDDPNSNSDAVLHVLYKDPVRYRPIKLTLDL